MFLVLLPAHFCQVITHTRRTHGGHTDTQDTETDTQLANY